MLVVELSIPSEAAGGISAVCLGSACELSSPTHRYLVWVLHSVSGGELQE